MQPTIQPLSLADRVIAFIREQVRPTWLVGGFVRDRLLGRDSHDLDLIVPEGGIRLARAVAAAFRARRSSWTTYAMWVGRS